MSISSSRPCRRAARWSARTAPIAVVGVIALAACGSSKPAYCSTRTNLENSIKALNPSSGVSSLQSQAKKIQTDANTLVSQAKSDFPSQTSAVKSSVDTLANSVKSLPANPSASQISTVAKDASNVSSSVSSFVDATNSKCS